MANDSARDQNNNFNELPTDIALLVKKLCQQAKQRLIISNLVKVLPLIALLVLLNNILAINVSVLLGITVLLVISTLLLTVYGKRFKRITPLNILLHLNRHYPVFEESAQLILENDKKKLLQQLQKQKIQRLFLAEYQRTSFALSKQKIAYLPWLTATLLISVLHWNFEFIDAHLNTLKVKPTNAPIHNNDVISVPSIVEQKVSIVSPKYTKRETIHSDNLDIEALAQSTIHWQLKMSDQSQTYFLMFSGQAPVELIKTEQGWFELKHPVTTTGLYRIAYSEQHIPLEQVYSVSVGKDEKPKITIVTPQKTITEIAKNATATIQSSVLVNDDFAITKVEILASVAKGSGESVKFRDQTFTFDSFSETDKGRLYEKNWDLNALGMEPGDEVYFTVYAWDNRQPTVQQTRSATSIIRWLDDDIEITTAEGIVINFESEYFRSQRQIIIETEQLILDKNDLSQQQLRAISEDLGQSQSDLKQRYGQYLGDEFGEGEGAEMLSNSNVDVSEPNSEALSLQDDEHLEHQKNAQQASTQIAEHGHEEHDHQNNNDKSGMSEILARFGHNHGEADLGPITKRNPKALMKRAVSIMWQAELHLMLSQPEKALPFEKEAYKYLKLAKQADRIYVKRLGFEPPPVKEDKRLSGELEDILSNNLITDASLNLNDDSILFQQLFQLFNEQQYSQQLSPAHLALIEEAKQRFTILAQDNPTLIKQAALLEQVIIAGSIAALENVKTCDDCVNKFMQKLWQILPAAVAIPTTRKTMVDTDSPLYKAYLLHTQKQSSAIQHGGKQ